jgi:hypothetical protein
MLEPFDQCLFTNGKRRQHQHKHCRHILTPLAIITSSPTTGSQLTKAFNTIAKRSKKRRKVSDVATVKQTATLSVHFEVI